MINPLSPKFYIHIQILQTDLHTFSLRISSENMIKDHRIFPLVIILLILITSSLDNVWILLGENCFWSLLNIPFNHEQPVKTVLATGNKILIIYRQTLNSKRFTHTVWAYVHSGSLGQVDSLAGQLTTFNAYMPN